MAALRREQAGNLYSRHRIAYPTRDVESILRTHLAGRRSPNYKCLLRQNWHISAYVSFACQLDRLLLHEYRKYYDLISGAGFSVDAVPSIAKEQAKREFQIVYRLRDKVFAHASYHDPKNDSVALQQSSLRVLLITRWSYHPDGRIRNSLTDDPASQTVVFDLDTISEATRQMIVRWSQRFMNLNEIISKITPQELCRRFGYDFIKTADSWKTKN